jgi:Lon protease-like protein
VHDGNDDFDDHNGQSAGVKPQTQSQSQSNCKALHLLNNVPIFPLRKFPRFPTDRLTLNLYEERYLQMADFILSARPAIFGAIFASGKPHLVTNGGLGPIVPLLQRGDMGTLFFVNDWQDDNVPVTGDATRTVQRRVRLNAIGFARFRIAGIVSDGTLSRSSERQSSSTSDCSSSQGCPYIQANLTLVCDQDESLLSNKKSTQEYAKVLQSLRKSNQQEEKSLMDPILEFSKIYSKITGDAASEHTSLAANYDELLSFFVVSKILNDKRKSPALMVSYLESQSTRERIERLKD